MRPGAEVLLKHVDRVALSQYSATFLLVQGHWCGISTRDSQALAKEWLEKFGPVRRIHKGELNIDFRVDTPERVWWVEVKNVTVSPFWDSRTGTYPFESSLLRLYPSVKEQVPRTIRQVSELLADTSGDLKMLLFVDQTESKNFMVNPCIGNLFDMLQKVRGRPDFKVACISLKNKGTTSENLEEIPVIWSVFDRFKA